MPVLWRIDTYLSVFIFCNSDITSIRHTEDLTIFQIINVKVLSATWYCNYISQCTLVLWFQQVIQRTF